MASINEILQGVWVWITSFTNDIMPVYVLPNIQLIIQIVILLIVGYIGGKIGKIIIVKILSVTGLRKITIRTWTEDILKAMGYKGTIVGLIGDLVKWFIYILVIGVIIDTLGFPGFVNIFNQIAIFVPKFIVAILIIVIGFLIADFFGKIFEEAGRRFIGEVVSSFSGGLVKYSIALVAIIMALGVIGLDTTPLNIMFTLILAAIVVVLTIGIKDMLPNVTSGMYLKKTLKHGEHIKIGHHSGIVEKIEPMAVTLRQGSKRILIPNHILSENPIERRTK
ncbi:MAG: mechanosensitive ion channel [Candidatus Aenigmatarchaeota archaeon]|nr:MAG: mechanosensitive ion channel [Candidatus Aenigmarchaeota archaeon]